MNKFIAELRRLNFLPEQPFQVLDAVGATAALNVIGVGGMARAMVVGFERAIDWEYAAKLYQTVCKDLELPAPAISVSGSDGYQLWFSLAEPLPIEQVRLFFNALRCVCLQDVAPGYLRFWPEAETLIPVEPSLVNLPPALDENSGKWSAFIDPCMGSMFVEEPGLEMAPTMDQQANLLSGFKSIKANDFRRALSALQAQVEAALTLSDQAATRLQERAQSPNTYASSSLSNISGYFSDPKSFLLAVMNDSSAPTDHRIEAAKALLPYFGRDTNT